MPVNKLFNPNFMPFSPNFMPFSPNFMPLTFLSLINKGFQRPELIELIEQERRYAFFGKNLGLKRG
jgi:hypothetical protein